MCQSQRANRGWNALKEHIEMDHRKLLTPPWVSVSFRSIVRVTNGYVGEVLFVFVQVFGRVGPNAFVLCS